MRMIAIIIFSLFTSLLKAPAYPGLVIACEEKICPYEKIWNATAQIESSNNPFAVNLKDPNGGSWGKVQIGQLKLSDYNKANGTNYTLQDCFNEEISRQVFMWHFMNYNSIETGSKAWNGSGAKVESYWTNIKVLL